MTRMGMQHKVKRGEEATGPIPYLAAAGLIGAWMAWIIVAQSIGTTAGEGVVGPGEKPFIYYVFHGCGLVAAIAAGVMAAAKGQYRRLDPLTKAAFWTLQLTAIIWALMSYSLADYLSFKAFGATGPFVWISTVLIFAGMDKRIWPLTEKMVQGIAVISACLAVVSVVTTHRDITQRWLSTPVYYMVLLMWFAGWTLLSSAQGKKGMQYWHFFPYITFVCLTIVTKTRSWLMMSIFLLIAFLALNKPANAKSASLFMHRVKAALVLLVAFSVVGFLLKEVLVSSFADFGDRALQDTRSGQYVDFFSDVPVSDLLLGRGPNGTWNWNGRDYQFFDNALLWMAFIGGLPTALSYVALVIWPGVRSIGSGIPAINTSAVLLLLWGLACTGFSTYSNPSLTPYSYLLCLLAGRCLSARAEQRESRESQVKSAPRPMRGSSYG